MIILLIVSAITLAFTLLISAHEQTHQTATFTLSTSFDYEARWPNGPGREFIYSMKITCSKYLDPLPLYSPRNSSVSPHLIHIENCALPTTPLANVCRMLDLDITRVNKLIIKDSSLPPSLPKNYTSGFHTLYTIKLSNVLNPTINFFKSITKEYVQIIIENMEIPEMEVNATVSTLKGGNIVGFTVNNAKIKKMFHCERIDELTIKHTREDQILDLVWPKGCVGLLRKFRLESLSQATVKRLETIMPTLFLNTLTIQNCSLVYLPLSFLGSLSHFNRLELPHNHLEDKAILQLPKLIALVTLDLSYNRLRGDSLKYMISGGSSRVDMETLILDGNNFTDIFEDSEIKAAVVNKSRLHQLSLKWMSLEPHSLSHMQFQWLERLDLNSNSSKLIENLQLHNLPSTIGPSQLTIDLSGHLVRSVSIGPNYTANYSDLHEPGHWLTSKGYKLVVFLDFIDCDCNNDALQYALKEFPEHLYMPAMRCNSKNGGLFMDEPVENLSCRKATVNGCKRIMSRDKNYTTVVDCSRVGDKFQWPKPQRFRGLNATRNNISFLENAYLPDTLEWLDLRHNNISVLKSDEVQLLFGTSNRRVWLDGNPILCFCENRKLLEAILRNHSQVVDYEDIKCNKSQTLIKEISVFEICKSGIVHRDYRTLGIVKDAQEKKIHCDTSLDAVKPFPTKMIFYTVSLYECVMPRIFLEDTLSTLNIDVTALKTLKLINVRMSNNIPKYYSAGLGIENLELIGIKDGVPYNFFQYQSNLRRLFVKDMVLPGLVGNNGGPLLELSIENSTVPFWSNCRTLQTLTLARLTEEQVPDTYDANCTGPTGTLRYLFLKDMSPGAAMKLMKNVNESSLIEFRCHNCSLVDNPLRLMSNFDRLDVLDLSYNNLEDQAFSQFPEIKSLKILNLSHNKLKGDFLLDVVPKIPELRELILDGNLFVHTFQNFQIKSVLV
ncbi:leucine rich repeat domain-containing protein [Phthorimaea operculella]|nr:leucine rich repeat domain-containing protein [Phthorimaea operculella]